MDMWMLVALVSGEIVIGLELSADGGQAFETTSTPNSEIKDVSTLPSIHPIESNLSNLHAKRILNNKSTTPCKRYGNAQTRNSWQFLNDSNRNWIFARLSSRKTIAPFYKLVNAAMLTTILDIATVQLTIGSRRCPEQTCR